MTRTIRVYDDGDSVADRYDVRIGHGDGFVECFGMSEDALMPNGCNYCHGDGLRGASRSDDDEGVRLVDLPKQVLVAIIRRMLG